MIAKRIMILGVLAAIMTVAVIPVCDAANTTLQIQHAYYQEQTVEGERMYLVTVDFNINPNDYCVTGVVESGSGNELATTYVERTIGTKVSIKLIGPADSGTIVSFTGDGISISASVTCKVDFYDGSVLKDTGYPGIGETITYRLTDASKSFVGWSVINGSDETVDSVSKSMNLYAVWKGAKVAHDINVTNDGHGSATANPSSAKDGVEVTLTPTPDEGYAFDKWETDSGIVINNNKFTMIDEEVSVKAVFKTASTYHVTVVCNPSNGGTASASPSDAVENTKIILTQEASNGYKFKGWTSSDVTEFHDNQWFSMLNKPVTVTAVFEKAYTIEYELNGGTNDPSAISSFMKSELPVDISKYTPTKKGYKFEYWSTENKADASKMITSITAEANCKVYAIWTPIDYNIAYQLNDGTMTGQKTSYTIESDTFDLVEPTKTGCKFAGWYDNEDFTGSNVTKIVKGSTGNKTFYAKWDEGYKIAYDLDGGTNSSSNPTQYYVDTATITLQDPTKTGYAFGGWYDNKDFTGSKVTQIVEGSTGDKKLYAKWDKQYSVTVNSNDSSKGSATASPSNPIAGQEVTLTPTAKTGYVLKKYSCSDSAVTFYDGNKFKMPAGNVTITAEFSDASTTYTVAFTSSNDSLGTVDVKQLKVSVGTTFTTSKNVMTFSDGQKATATVKENTQTGKVNVLTGWSLSSGTISGNTSVKASFETKNIYDSRTVSSDTGVKLTGSDIRYDAVLQAVKKAYNSSDWTGVDPEYSKETYERTVYEMSLKSETDDKARDPGTSSVTLTIPIDSKFNGQSAAVFCKSGTTIKSLGKTTVTNGSIVVTTADISTFLIACEKVSAVTGVTLDINEITLKTGADRQLAATVTPSDAKVATVTWKSSDTGVATVDSNGKVTAVSEGKATITVKTDDGDFTDSCEVTVKNNSIMIYAIIVIAFVIIAIAAALIIRNRSTYDFEKRTRF